MRNNWLDWLSFTLVIIGAINWGLVGAFDFNLVDELFNAGSTLSELIYILVGIAGLYLAVWLTRQFANTNEVVH